MSAQCSARQTCDLRAAMTSAVVLKGTGQCSAIGHGTCACCKLPKPIVIWVAKVEICMGSMSFLYNSRIPSAHQVVVVKTQELVLAHLLMSGTMETHGRQTQHITVSG